MRALWLRVLARVLSILIGWERVWWLRGDPEAVSAWARGGLGGSEVAWRRPQGGLEASLVAPRWPGGGFEVVWERGWWPRGGLEAGSRWPGSECGGSEVGWRRFYQVFEKQRKIEHGQQIP